MNAYHGHSFSFRHLALGLMLFVLPMVGFAGEVQAWVLLLLNPAAPATIVSTDSNETAGLVKMGWKISGTGMLQSEAGADLGALHRMVRMKDAGADRAVAAVPGEVAILTKDGYRTEGVLGYASLKEQSGATAVVHYTKAGHSIWLIDPIDAKWAQKLGWKQDGVAFWLFPVH